MKRMSLFVVLMCALSVWGPVDPAVAKPATAKVTPAPVVSSASDVVKNFYTQLISTMKQGDQLGFTGRYKKLEPAVKSAFDLPVMTRVAVGPNWSKATPDEQGQLTEAFSNFSVANYASRFAKYDGEQFDVVDEKPTTGGLIVETKLTPKEGDPVVLSYLMRTDEKGAWRIVDVFLDGSISELATRRAEFNSIATRDGIPALVNSLGEKSKQMGPS